MHPIRRTEREKGRVKSLRPLFRYLFRYRLLVLGAAVSLVISSGAVLGLGQGLRFLIDQGFGVGDAPLLNQAFGMLLGIAVILAAASYARFFFVTQLGERVVADIRRNVYRHLLELSPAFYEHAGAGEIVSRMTTDTTLLQFVMGSSLAIAARNILLLIGGVTMLVLTSAKLAVSIAIAVPIVVLPVLFLGGKVRKLSRASQNRVAEIAGTVEETVNAIKTVQAFGREDYENGRFGERVQTAFLAAMQRVRLRALLTALVILLAFGSVSFVLWTGGHDVLRGEMSFGELSAFLFYSLLVAGAFGALSEVAGDLQRAGGAAERLMELMQVHAAVTSPARPVVLPRTVKGALSFKNVSFAYPGRPEIEVLKAISFSVRAGETVALVGPSGAGKSTIFQLLLRFYDAGKGVITLDKVAIEKLDLQVLRRQFALVSQEPVIFTGTARENIRYGNLAASDKEVLEAARAARADEFIAALPQGYDTPLGEKGVMLSGGQRQRIAIARAVLKNPKVLLLDEATSSLDAENEKLVQAALETLMRGRTTLVIAHRLATVLNADRILVLNQGGIEAEGTHKELLSKSALYARLAAMQFGIS